MGFQRFEQAMELLVPSGLAASWDHVGWQVRLEDTDLRGVLLALDATTLTIAEAAERGCNLLLAHHPLLFRPLSSLDARHPTAAAAIAAVRAGVSVFAAHTNLDAVPWGTSGVLAEGLGLDSRDFLDPARPAAYPEPAGIGMVGNGPALPLVAWEERLRAVVGAPSLHVLGDPQQHHSRVAVVAGSGAGLMSEAVAAGATLLITADLKYHQAQEARARGLALIVPDHFVMERPVLPRLAERLASLLDVRVVLSEQCTSPWEAPKERP